MKNIISCCQIQNPSSCLYVGIRLPQGVTGYNNNMYDQLVLSCLLNKEDRATPIFHCIVSMRFIYLSDTFNEIASILVINMLWLQHSCEWQVRLLFKIFGIFIVIHQKVSLAIWMVRFIEQKQLVLSLAYLTPWLLPKPTTLPM